MFRIAAQIEQDLVHLGGISEDGARWRLEGLPDLDGGGQRGAAASGAAATAATGSRHKTVIGCMAVPADV